MGNAEWGPIHNVTLSAFAIMTTELTQEQFLLVAGYNPSYWTGDLTRPAENETWYEAVLYCNELSRKAGLDTCYTYSSAVYAGGFCTELVDLAWDTTVLSYRLPTEAEYEYAHRAGTTSDFYWGDVLDTAYCWHFSNSQGTTHPVAQLLPNDWGLYDMSGNVWEWTWDWYEDYTGEDLVNPKGPATGANKVNRGGSYGQEMTGYFMSGFRNPTSPPNLRGRINGFRVVIPR
jgi:formylglycine-generating enzyme required for sulfatase activity